MISEEIRSKISYAVEDFLLIESTYEYIQQKSTEIFQKINLEPCPIFLIPQEDFLCKKPNADGEFISVWFSQGIFDTEMKFINLSLNHIPLYDPYYIDRVITHEILHKKQVDNNEPTGHTEQFYNDLKNLGFEYKSFEKMKDLYG